MSKNLLFHVAGPTAGLAFVCLLGLAACKSGAPSKEELDRLIDERLSERGLAPLPSSSGASAAAGPSSSPSAAHSDSQSKDPADASLAFLAKLDELMRSYAPEIPATEDKGDVLRCVTSDAIKSNPDLQKVASTLKQKGDVARRERKRKESDFFKSIYPLAFHYDIDWQTRKGTAAPDVFGCWGAVGGGPGWLDGVQANGYVYDNADGCSSSPLGLAWRLRSPSHPALFVYSGTDSPPAQPPEMMRRMEAASVTPLARFSCRVDDLVTETDHKTVKCVASGAAASLRISSGVGALKPVNAGDLVSVPLAATKRDPEGVLFKSVAGKSSGWIVDADGASLAVDSAATCPSMAEILATVGKAGTR